MSLVEMHPPDAVHADVVLQERRRFPRLKVGVPVEYRAEGAEVASHTQTTDISCGGCYIESTFTVPVGTRLDLILWLNDVKISTKGSVVTHHPCFGNGVQFLDM